MRDLHLIKLFFILLQLFILFISTPIICGNTKSNSTVKANELVIKSFQSSNSPLNDSYAFDSYTAPVAIEPVSVKEGLLVLDEYSNAYAHIETNIGEYSILETKVRVTSGLPGWTWGPGIGLWINESYAFHFGFGHLPEALRFSYSIRGNYGHSYLPISILYDTWIWLRVNLTIPNRVYLEYSLNGSRWLDFHEGSMISSGQNITTLSFPSDFNNVGLLIVGKGLPVGFDNIAVGTEEFDTYYPAKIGSIGVTEIDFYSVASFIKGTSTSTDIGSSKSTESPPIIVSGFRIYALFSLVLISLLIQTRRRKHY